MISTCGDSRLRRDRNPGDQSPAADRHEQRVEARVVGKHFERDRPLPGDDRRIVIGVDRHEAALGGQRIGGTARIDKAVAAQHDPGAQRLGAIDLRERRAGGHDDRRRDAETARMIGDALGVVAGRHRDDPGTPLRRSERHQLVERAALLEGAGRLLRFELQKDLASGNFGQRGGPDQRRSHDLAGDCRLGPADIVNRDRQIDHGAGSRVRVATGAALPGTR